MSKASDLYTLAECVADYKKWAGFYSDEHKRCRTYVRMLRMIVETKVSGTPGGDGYFEFLFDTMGDTDWDAELSAAEALMGIER